MPRTKVQKALLSISTAGVSFYDLFQVHSKSPNCPSSAWLIFVFCPRVYTAEVGMKMGCLSCLGLFSMSRYIKNLWCI